MVLAGQKKLNKYLVVFGIFLFLACADESKKTSPAPAKKPVAEKTIKVPKFSADSAYNFIAKQVEFGPRVPGTKEHNACGDYLVNKLSAYADTVIEQKGQVKRYDGKMMPMRNIIASFNPNKSNRIVLAAHWDTRFISDQEESGERVAIDGANDGGSGVGVLLELARLFSKEQPSLGIDIVLFDVEDQGKPEGVDIPNDDGRSWCLGSQHWSKNPHKPNYYAKYGILLDMVAAEGAMFTWEGVSKLNAPDVLRRVWTVGENLGYAHHFSRQETQQIMDDHVYMNYFARIPTIDIIEYNPQTDSHFYQHWHTKADNMDGISKATLQALGNTLTEFIYKEK